MTVYTAVLFVHVVAVLALTAALAVEAWMLLQMRRSASLNEIRLWTVPLPGLGLAAIISLAVLYATGAFLTERLGAWDLAWPRFAVLEVVLFALFGALTGRRLRTIRRLCATFNNKGSEVMNHVLSPFLKISLSIRVWVVIGTVLLMAAKPGLKESLSIVLLSLVLGSISALLPFGESASEQRHTI